MAKLKVNIYWKGVWCASGTEAPEGVPARFTEGELKGAATEKVSAKARTGSPHTKEDEKEKKVEIEDKNGEPKKRSTKKK